MVVVVVVVVVVAGELALESGCGECALSGRADATAAAASARHFLSRWLLRRTMTMAIHFAPKTFERTSSVSH